MKLDGVWCVRVENCQVYVSGREGNGRGGVFIRMSGDRSRRILGIWRRARFHRRGSLCCSARRICARSSFSLWARANNIYSSIG